MSERNGLQSKIQGKDPNLVAAEINRIAEIDNQLKTIGENAVKESNIEEVTAEGGGVQYQGTQEGQPEVGQGEGAVGQAAQPETDLGNRPVEGRSEAEVDKLIEDRIAKYNLQPDDLFADMSEADNNIIEKASRGDSVDINALNGTIDYLYNKYKEIINLKKNNEERLNKSTTLGNLNDIQQKIENDLDFLITYKGEVEQGNNPITIEEFNSRPITERKVSTEEVSQDIAPTQPTAAEEALKDVESTAKALRDNEEKGGAPLRSSLVDDNTFKELNERGGLGLNDIISEAYHADKAAGKETELTKAVEELLGKETEVVPTEPTVAETVVEQPAAEEANVTEEVERLGKLLEGTDEQIDEQLGKLRISKGNNKVAQSIANAAKSIAKILPDVKFVVHDTDESYRKATGEQNRKQSTAGEYNPKTRTIHINGTKANNRTAAHEVFHAVILEGVKNNAEAARLTKAMIDAVRKSLVNVDGAGEIISYLNDFASNYKENIQNEEKLAELFAILSDSYATLPMPTQSLIRRFLDRIAKMFGLKPLTDREVIDFMNIVSFAVAEGDEIQARQIPGISKSKIIWVISIVAF